MTEKIKCCICGEEFEGFGNNPWPIVEEEDARCCDACNNEHVVPARFEQALARMHDEEAPEIVHMDWTEVLFENAKSWIFEHVEGYAEYINVLMHYVGLTDEEALEELIGNCGLDPEEAKAIVDMAK